MRRCGNQAEIKKHSLPHPTSRAPIFLYTSAITTSLVCCMWWENHFFGSSSIFFLRFLPSFQSYTCVWIHAFFHFLLLFPHGHEHRPTPSNYFRRSRPNHFNVSTKAYRAQPFLFPTQHTFLSRILTLPMSLQLLCIARLVSFWNICVTCDAGGKNM